MSWDAGGGAKKRNVELNQERSEVRSAVTLRLVQTRSDGERRGVCGGRGEGVAMAGAKLFSRRTLRHKMAGKKNKYKKRFSVKKVSRSFFRFNQESKGQKGLRKSTGVPPPRPAAPLQAQRGLAGGLGRPAPPPPPHPPPPQHCSRPGWGRGRGSTLTPATPGFLLGRTPTLTPSSRWRSWTEEQTGRPGRPRG